MNNNKIAFLLPVLALAAASQSHAVTVVITPGTYTETFNDMGVSDTRLNGWSLTTGATASSLGTAQTVSTTTRAWNYIGSAFANTASVQGLTTASNSTAQNSSTNRVLGLNPGGGFSPWNNHAFNFNFSTTDVSLDGISFDLITTRAAAAGVSTVWAIQYGYGETPTSFTTLDTWTMSATTAWGQTSFTFDRADFTDDLDEQSQIWFRVVTASRSGSGDAGQMGIDNFSFTASAVPEPSAALLGALGALGLLRRRR